MNRRRRKWRQEKGPGGWLGWVSLFFVVVGLGVVGLFVVSRVVTDLFLWSQWVWWVPSGWFVVLGVGLLVGGRWAMGKRGERKAMGNGQWAMGKRRGVLWGVLLVGCLGMVLYVVLVDWRVQNVIGGKGIDWAQGEGDTMVRVLHWNLSAGEIDVEKTVKWIGESDVDVVLIANPRFDGQRRALMSGLRGVAGEDGTVRRLSRAIVASRFALVRASTIYLSASGGDGTGEDAIRATGDFGWVALLRFDGGEDVGEFNVWFVDLPSEPSVHRVESIGRVVELLKDSARDQKLALKPALIIGDFNVVRGSGSLGLFDVFEGGDGFVDAFEERGAFGGSWRPTGAGGLNGWVAGRSSWGIDLSLVGNGWGVEGYGVLMPDGGEWGVDVSHRAQVVDLKLVK